jgi:hypothetical protein
LQPNPTTTILAKHPASITTLVLFLLAFGWKRRWRCKGLCYTFYLCGGKTLASRSFGGKEYLVDVSLFTCGGGVKSLNKIWTTASKITLCVKALCGENPSESRPRKEQEKRNKKNIISIMIAERIANREQK